VKQLLDNLKTREPIFAPNQQSTYSNLNYELLGLVLENVTGLPYADYMNQAIFDPLELGSTTLSKPSDKHAVLPVGQYFWDVEEGVHSPTGAIYSSSSDLSKYIRYVLTHYNALATGVNWLFPASWSTGLRSFYGMPWEILRTEKILKHTLRPVTFVTKAGGVPSYYSRISLMPEYGLGLTILTAGTDSLLGKVQEAVTVPLIQAAETLIWDSVNETYAGTYVAIDHDLNSTLTLAVTPEKGLHLTNFISNSTDVFQTFLPIWAGALLAKSWHAGLVPTLLFKNETAQQGEIWRMDVFSERTGDEGVWADFCNTDLDPASYAGKPINEIVFWHEHDVVELPAWRVKMKRVTGGGNSHDGLLVQY
jgi:hypothetical protein